MARHFYTSLALALITTGCAVGPDYVKPKDIVPVTTYSESSPWKQIAPKDTLPKEGWWLIYHDTTLNNLEKEVVENNSNLKAAYQRFLQARSIARANASNLGPSFVIQSSGGQVNYSGNRQTQPHSTALPYNTNTYDLPLDLNYELDLFGRVRRSVESTKALAEASEASYRNILLSIEAEAAQDYYTLRSLETQRHLLQAAVEGRKEELSLVQLRKKEGASNELEVYQARTQLDTALSALLSTQQHIASLRHALATLTGKTNDAFALEITEITELPPVIPIGLPSDLLERRPDVAQAEKQLAFTSAQIGVAKAAFYPNIKLTAAAGFNSTSLSTLLNSSSKEGFILPFITLPIFTEGLNKANYEHAKEAYAEALSNYKQSLLSALEDVENGLSDLRYLNEQVMISRDNVDASKNASNLSLLRYKQGVANYFEVVDSDRTSLQAEVSDSQLIAQYYIAHIHLIKALGGGW
jgi:outer membrane protein, multidrug efflux system